MTLATITNPVINAALGTPSTSPTATYNRLENLISLLVGVFTVAGSVWFIFQIFSGAFQWISAGSDKDAVQKAQRKFSNAIVGLIVLLFSYTLIAFVGYILGYNIFGITTGLQKAQSIMP